MSIRTVIEKQYIATFCDLLNEEIIEADIAFRKEDCTISRKGLESLTNDLRKEPFFSMLVGLCNGRRDLSGICQGIWMIMSEGRTAWYAQNKFPQNKPYETVQEVKDNIIAMIKQGGTSSNKFYHIFENGKHVCTVRGNVVLEEIVILA